MYQQFVFDNPHVPVSALLSPRRHSSSRIIDLSLGGRHWLALRETTGSEMGTGQRLEVSRLSLAGKHHY
jgi:hypothetical protein